MAGPLSIKSQSARISDAIRRNIDTVTKLEEDFLQSRSVTERLADTIGSFTGSLRFVALHAAVYSVWIAINLGALPFIPRFDPYPFLLLSVVVSIEAIFLSTFVLMKQNRMSRREELRAHLDLQINLLSEREMTLVLQMLQGISERLGMPAATEQVQELSEVTPVDALGQALREKLPEE